MFNWSPANTRSNYYLCKACHCAKAAATRAANPGRAAIHNKNNQKRNAAPRIYVVTNPAWEGYVKIGKTINNPTMRLCHLRNADPFRAHEYAALVEVDDAGAAERAIHRALYTRREAHSEWFRVHPKLAIALCERFQKGDSATCQTTPTPYTPSSTPAA